MPFRHPDTAEHSLCIADSFRYWKSCELLHSFSPEALYHAPFVVVSHGVEPDPVFRYANLAAQALWGMNWAQFTALPSRLSAEADAQDERERLLRRAAAHGFVDDYAGVRVTAAGRRFRIRGCVLWNVLNKTHDKIGQAASFSSWEWL